MDPIIRRPDNDHGRHTTDSADGTAHPGGGDTGRPRATRDDLPATLGPGKAPAPARTTELVSGDFLLTVNPVDGSEIEPCPPGRRPETPARRTREERAEHARAATAPVPAGPTAPPPPLLERDEQRERLVRLLSRGRSVRLTGPSGSGRSRLLDVVADACADLAPDGVIRLSGHRRTPVELLYDLFAAVHRAPGHRPDRAGLHALVREIGAVVLVDDLEFGGPALDELLDAAPECAFLLAATPDIPAPSPDAAVEEVFLVGLDRATTLELLAHAVDRPLTEDETNWAGDLWFESEGLPLRFLQAAALLRQRDVLRTPDTDADPDDEDADDNVFTDTRDVPLPRLGETVAPAALLASRLSEAARETLRFALALGGEVPHQAHLPALVGDTHADAALGELLGCGLLTAVGPRHRLAAGIAEQLTERGYGEGALTRVHTAAQHYAWWVGHPSVAPERVAAEADAVLAALTALAPSQEAGHASAAVLLARSAAPAFAAALHWGAWERALRAGQGAARLAGEVAEEAYFHHELGVLALCAGHLDRARAELEASIGMRGALADKRGTVAGRRALALVADRERAPRGGAGDTPAPWPAVRRADGPADAATGPDHGPDLLGSGAAVAAVHGSKAAGLGAGPASGSRSDGFGSTYGVKASGSGTGDGHGLGTGSGAYGYDAGTVGSSAYGSEAGAGAGRRSVRSTVRRALLSGARRNLVAAGAGALLAAVLGTVVTLGATSGGGADGGGSTSDKVTTESSAGVDSGDGGLDTDVPGEDDATHDPGATGGGSSSVGTDPTGETPGSSARPGATGGTGDPSTPSTDDPSTTPGGSSTTGGTPSSARPDGPGTSPSSSDSTGVTSPKPSTSSSDPTGGTTTSPDPTGGTSTGTTGEPSGGTTTTGGAAGGTEGGTEGGGDSSSGGGDTAPTAGGPTTSGSGDSGTDGTAA